jgi:pimeloyl-ACP methyl ester carboxylesterase
VRKTSTFTDGRPPTSLVDRTRSFPIAHDDPNGEQIRIDRYSQPGKADKFEVFIGGTATFDPRSTTQPFDFTSDMHGVAGLSPGSLRAVEEAMDKAGITSSSPVVLNGYSQGGLIASQVAASGHYNVHGVVTFGAPSAQVNIPASVPVLSVRNTEDLVPATAGFDVNPHAVIVERSAFAGTDVPSSDAVPAHLLSTYAKTAAVVDKAQSSEVRSVLDSLDSFGAGTVKVTSTMWLATRG